VDGVGVGRPGPLARAHRPGVIAAVTSLVIGAGGFIGSTVCRCLLEQGESVRAMLRPGSASDRLAGLSDLEIVRGDSTVPETLTPAMVGVERVYNLAGLVADWGPWSAFEAANIAAVRHVMEAAVRAGTPRVVHVSSVSVYGFPGGRELDEDTPWRQRPGDPYVTSKAAGERIAMGYRGCGPEVAVVRPGTVYGPGDRTTTAPLAAALRARRLPLVDGGRYLMGPAYVDHVADIVHRAGTQAAAAGQAFNAVDDGETSWREFIGWMCADLGVKPPRLSLPSQLAWPLAVACEGGARLVRSRRGPPVTRYRVRALARDHHYSNTKARRVLGFRPQLPTREGVRRAVDWYLWAVRGHTR